MEFISKYKYLLILIGLFLAQFLLISPLGEFPLNDDWVHIEMIKHWTETGLFRFNPYTGPLLYFPILYGAALTKIFGFSFSILRLSTLALTALLTIGTFLLMHKKTNHVTLSFLAALTIWFNPIVYSLSFSFMTDVPALALLLVSIIYFSRAQETNHWQYFFWGGAAAVLGFYTRQTNILILAAFGLFVLFDRQLRNCKNIAALGIPTAIAAAAYWFLYTHNLLPGGEAFHYIKDKRLLFEHAFLWFWYTFLYLGLFTVPLTITVWHTNWRNKKYALAAALGLLLPIILFFWRHELFPYVSNTINQYGIGPFADVLQGHYAPLFRMRVWLAVSGIAGIGTGLLTVMMWDSWRERAHRWLYLALVFFLLFIMFLTGFDRYFLPLTLIAIFIIAPQLKNTKLLWSGWILIGILAIFSVSQTHFYMNWNRVRAEMNSVAIGVIQTMPQYTKVDGGYEWTGFLGYWEAQKDNVNRGQNDSPWWIKFLMTNNTAEYVISASPLPNYTPVFQNHVAGWNPNNRLFLLRRNQ